MRSLLRRFSPNQPLLRRFCVTGASMEPALSDGDLVIGIASRRAKAGQCRVFEHPFQPGMWLVKRVGAVRDGKMWLISDNAETTLADSRTFGHLDPTGSYRVVLRLRGSL